MLGTSAVVYPAANLIPLARRAGAKAIEVNLDETPMSSLVDAALRGQSGEILLRLLPAQVWSASVPRRAREQAGLDRKSETALGWHRADFLPGQLCWEFLRNTRKTDSLRRGIASGFLAVWRRACAAFALLRWS